MVATATHTTGDCDCATATATATATTAHDLEDHEEAADDAANFIRKVCYDWLP